MEILWIGKTGDANVWYHTYPFAVQKKIKKIHIVRYKKPQKNIPNSLHYNFTEGNFILSFFKILFISIRILKNHKINHIVTFNPMPWGLVAWIIAKLSKTPISIGFIGSDFYSYIASNSIIGWLLLYVCKNSDIVTVTGNNMKNKLIEHNLPDNRIIIFPHCVDDKWFTDKTINKYKYDLISVCKFEKRKRLEDIIMAVNNLKENNKIELKLCLLGDGETMDYIKKLVTDLKLEDLVHLPGYSNNVYEFLKSSKVYVQASENEGLSLALIEAMSLGLVPVTTEAGSEKDIIEDNFNGLFFNIGDIEGLVTLLIKISDEKEFKRIKKNVNKTKMRFSIKNAIDVANKISLKINDV